MIESDFDACCHSLSRLGVHVDPDHLADRLEFCGVDWDKNRKLGYRRKIRIGERLTTFEWRPIARAWACRKSLIGFMYPDGGIRQDGDVLVSHITGAVHVPCYVIFWRPHVPFSRRTGLAAARGPHDNRIFVGAGA